MWVEWGGMLSFRRDRNYSWVPLGAPLFCLRHLLLEPCRSGGGQSQEKILRESLSVAAGDVDRKNCLQASQAQNPNDLGFWFYFNFFALFAYQSRGLEPASEVSGKDQGGGARQLLQTEFVDDEIFAWLRLAGLRMSEAEGRGECSYENVRRH